MRGTTCWHILRTLTVHLNLCVLFLQSTRKKQLPERQTLAHFSSLFRTLLTMFMFMLTVIITGHILTGGLADGPWLMGWEEGKGEMGRLALCDSLLPEIDNDHFPHTPAAGINWLLLNATHHYVNGSLCAFRLWFLWIGCFYLCGTVAISKFRVAQRWRTQPFGVQCSTDDSTFARWKVSTLLGRVWTLSLGTKWLCVCVLSSLSLQASNCFL